MSNFILDKTQYLKFQAKFKDLAQNKSLSASDFVVYNFIRGYPLNRGFTKITNGNKLNCSGMSEWFGFKQAVDSVVFRLNYNKKYPERKMSNPLIDIIPADVLATWQPDMWKVE